MLFNYTESDLIALQELDDRYISILDKLKRELEKETTEEKRSALNEKIAEINTKLIEERQAMRDAIELQHFQELDGLEAIRDHAIEHIDELIPMIAQNDITHYTQEKIVTGLRYDKDGAVKVDSALMKSLVKLALYYHFAEFKTNLDRERSEKYAKEVEAYIEKAVKASPLTTSTGRKVTEKDGGNIIISHHPKRIEKRKMEISRLARLILSGDLCDNGSGEKIAVWLSQKQRDERVTPLRARVITKPGEIKRLPPDMREVYTCIVSHVMAGNYAVTDAMVYRALIGSPDRDNYKIPDDIKSLIIEAERKIAATIVDAVYEKKIDGELLQMHYFGQLIPGGRIGLRENGQLIEINGQKAEGYVAAINIQIPLYAFSEDNRNEIETSDITLNAVPGIHITRKNIALRYVLFDRLCSMRAMQKRQKWNLEIKNRTIRFDTLIKDTEIIKADELNRVEKSRILKTIDKMLQYWTDKGYIYGYGKRRGSKGAYDAYIIAIRKTQITSDMYIKKAAAIADKSEDVDRLLDA